MINKKEKKTIKKDDNDNQVIENNIKINIDLNDLKKPEKKKKRKPRKKKVESNETLGGGVGGAMGGGNYAPKSLSATAVKIPSTDSSFNPNSTTNMIISSALQNALSGRPNFNFPALTAPSLPSQQQLLQAPPQQQLLQAPPQQQLLQAPPPQPQITAIPTPPQITAIPTPPQTPQTPQTPQSPINYEEILKKPESKPFYKAIANLLAKNDILKATYIAGKGKPGPKRIDKQIKQAINDLRGSIRNLRIGNTTATLGALQGQNLVNAFYKFVLEDFKKIVDNLPPPSAAATAAAGSGIGVSVAPLIIPINTFGTTGITTLNTPTAATPTTIASS